MKVKVIEVDVLDTLESCLDGLVAVWKAVALCGGFVMAVGIAGYAIDFTSSATTAKIQRCIDAGGVLISSGTYCVKRDAIIDLVKP